MRVSFKKLQSLSLVIRQLAAAALILLSFILWNRLPQWETAARWVQMDFNLYAFYPLAVAALSISALRGVLFGRPRWAAALVFYGLTYPLVFSSRALPAGIRPTLLSIFIYFHAVALFLVLAWDPLAAALTRIAAHPRVRRLDLPVVRFLLTWALLAGFAYAVRSAEFDDLNAWITGHLLVCVLLLPFAGAWLRRRYAGRPLRYGAGVALTAVCLWAGIVAAPWPVDTLLVITFPLYTAIWLFLYLEEGEAFLRAWSAPFSRMPLFSKLGGMIAPLHARTVAARAPASLPTERVERVIAHLSTWPGHFKRWMTGGAVRAKQNERWIQVGAIAMAALALGLWSAPHLYRHFYVTVTEFSPTGQVPPKTVIRISFSDSVKPINGDVSKLNCFHIDPPLAGMFRQEGPKTLAFLPSVPLAPSTPYRVRFDAAGISAAPRRLQGSAQTEFHTDYFQVTDTKLFYSYDLVTNEERQLTGEINFNLPVSIEELRKDLQVFKGKDQAVPVELERAHVPTRFYFKTGNIQRSQEEQIMTLQISKGMRCIGGSVGLRQDFRKQLTLPSKVKLEVSELKLWHEPGNTLVSVLFNMPVSDAQLRAHLSISPPVSYRIETEYCYAVLRGDFKPNVRYNVKVEKGLAAKSGELLEEKYEGGVTIEDLPAKVEFAQHGNLLTLSGPKTIAVRSVNLDKVHVDIQKVFRNNLIQFLNNQQVAPMSAEVFSGEYSISEGQVNEELTQYISLDKFNQQPYKGLFTIRLKDSKNYSDSEWAWFLCTDLGLLAKHSGDDLWVYVMSIEKLAPMAGATVQLYSDTNQVIDKGVTDGNGRVVFPHWQKNEFKFRPQFLIAQKDDDFSFMSFDQTALNQHQFAIGGDAYGKAGMEAFLTPERGVYRPGEKAFVTVIVRDGAGAPPPALPLRLKVRDPRGAEVQRMEQTPNDNGVLSFTVPFAGDALTGHYTLELTRLEKEEVLGATSLKVEEFIPDKLKVQVYVPKEAISAGQPLTFKVQGRQMFGPAAASAKVVTTVRYLTRDFTSPAFKGFVFSDPTRTFEEESDALGEEKLDAQGVKDYTVEVPRGSPPSALKAYIYSEVFDSGGRPVSAAGVVDINPYPKYLGIHLLNDAPIHAREKVNLAFASVTPQGKPVAEDNVHIVIKRKAWYSIFRKSAWGRSGYESSSYEELVEHRQTKLSGQQNFEFTPQQAGEYTVFLAGPSGMRSGVTFEVLGSGYESTSLESPEKLKIVLDKDAYNVGDQAHILVQTPFAGKLLLTLEREKVYETRTIEVTGHEASVTIPVEARDLPNMYVVGVLLRTPDEARKTLPMVSFGIANMTVKPGSKKIGMSWDVPAQVPSSGGIDVSLTLPTENAGADVVLAAVDEGILQITNFTTPSALDFFYRKRGLTTQSYSIFDLVLPDLAGKKFALGGDEGARFSRRHLNPIAAKKKKPMALYSGVLHPDAQGHVRYHFDTHGFNGEVRLMALAVHGDRYGASEQPTQVADPLVLIPNYPAFVAPGDQFQIPVEIYNKTGKRAAVRVKLHVKGPMSLVGDAAQSFTLEPEDQKKVHFFAEASRDAGVARFHLEASAAEFASQSDDEVSVRPANTLVTRVEQGELAPGHQQELSVPGGFISFGQKVRLSISNNPMALYLRSLDYLIQYPYGCAEQVASQIFPLIYFKELGFSTGRFADKANAVDLFVQAGIDKLEKQQLPDGRFSLWPGGEAAEPWVCHYVAHCLLSAQAQGYSVSPLVLQRIESLLKQGGVIPVNEGRLDRRTQNQNNSMDTYLLYLKTLVAAPDRESMTVLRQTRLASLGEMDRDLLSLAYSEIGDHDAAEKILTPDFKSRLVYREQYGSFNSPVRNTALYLLALTKANPNSEKIPQIVAYLAGQLKEGHFGNTQEDCWTFLALGQVYKALGKPVQATLLLDGKPYRTVSDREAVIADDTLSGHRLSVQNAGAEKLYFYLMAEGTPLEKSTSVDKTGLAIERAYLNAAGKPVNLSNVLQGDLMVVNLTVRPLKSGLHNVVAVDLLPAGFEIENPRLRSRGQLGFDPQVNFNAAYQDIRDDRVLLFADELGAEAHFAYTVRAVTGGHFSVPNAYAEAMYDPDLHGHSYEPSPLVIVDNNGK